MSVRRRGGHAHRIWQSRCSQRVTDGTGCAGSHSRPSAGYHYAQKTDGAAGAYAFKNTRQDFHLVGLLARCGQGALSGAAAVEFGLDKVCVNFYSGRKTVKNAANAGAVALAKGGEPEEGSKRVHHSED